MKTQFIEMHTRWSRGEIETSCRLRLRVGDVHAKDAIQSTPLHYAAEPGQLTMVRLLLEVLLNMANQWVCMCMGKEGVAYFGTGPMPMRTTHWETHHCISVHDICSATSWQYSLMQGATWASATPAATQRTISRSRRPSAATETCRCYLPFLNACEASRPLAYVRAIGFDTGIVAVPMPRPKLAWKTKFVTVWKR
eukprot:m.462128 g.462128  ORF g.462128 m.462128 type:complete len:195 (+) comp21602_c1_seq1:830-1414(+)